MSYQYILLCTRGLESIVIDEIHGKLSSNATFVSLEYVFPTDAPTQDKECVVVHRGQAGVGKLILSMSAALDAQDFFSHVHSIQSVLVYIYHAQDFPTDSCVAVERYLDQALAGCVPKFHEALDLFHHSTSSCTHIETFRASVIRDACSEICRHGYNSTDVAGALGSFVSEHWMPTARVSLKTFDIQVVGIVLNQTFVLGLPIFPYSTSVTFQSRLPPEPCSFLPFRQSMITLRPSTTYCLLELANIETGDVILDPMCGIGTIPFATAVYHASTSSCCLGGDICGPSLAQGLKNVMYAREQHSRYHHRTATPELLQWDCQRLPLRDAVVDKVIVDMPFGVRCSTFTKIHKLIPRFFKELERVLSNDNGQAWILLLMSKWAVSFLSNHSTTTCPRLHVQRRIRVNIGGLECEILHLIKVTSGNHHSMMRT